MHWARLPPSAETVSRLSVIFRRGVGILTVTLNSFSSLAFKDRVARAGGLKASYMSNTSLPHTREPENG
jgi:hypothetical protein